MGGGGADLAVGAVDDAGAALHDIEGVAGLARLQDGRACLHMQRPQCRAQLRPLWWRQRRK
jgi:hypothetical protein